MRINTLHILFLLVFPYVSYGQQLNFQRFTMQDGLAHIGTDYPNSILKDREGFVWFATFNGLSRFDGENFKNYKNDPTDPKSIGANLLTSLGEDEQGRIWVGTVNRGIFIFDKKEQAFSTFRTTDEAVDFTLKATIHFIEKDRDGNMWFGGDNGVGRWNPETGRAESIGEDFQNAYFFYQQKSGVAWIGSQHGLHRQRHGQPNFETIPLPGNAGPAISLLELDNGQLWVTAVPGLFWELDPGTLEFRDLRPTISFTPASLEAGINGDVWLWNGQGILRYNQNSGAKQVYRHEPDKPLSLPAALLTAFFLDEKENLFVITRDKGVAMAHIKPSPFEVIGDIRCIEAIMLDDRRLLIRDFEKGGIVYDTRKKTFLDEKLPVGPGSTYCPSMAVRGDSLLWIWSGDKISSYHLRTGETAIAPPNPAFSLYVHIDKKGRVWNGLSYLDEKEGKWTDIYPDLQACFPALAAIRFSYACINFDEKNHLWVLVVGHNKVIRYDLETKSGKEYDIDGNPWRQKPNGQLYIQSPEGLGVYLPEKDSFMLLTEKEGLMHSMAYHIVDDAHKHAWISTPKGLQRYDWASGESTIFDYRDGFPGAGHTLVRLSVFDADGNIYNTINMEKVFRFHPDSIRANPESASVHLLDFFLNASAVKPDSRHAILQKTLRFSEGIQLKYDQADFGFSYTMPVFYKADKIEYFYRLEPYQTEWQTSGTSNEVQFTNISPGNYIFRVKARTAAGMWSENEATVAISISPPWWDTWWAYLLYGLLFLTAVYSIYHFNLNRRLEKEEALRLKELDSLKSRLYTNITHEFRTPLTVIMGMADNIGGYEQERRLIRRNSKNLLRLINQLLDLSKLDSGSMKMDLVQGDIVNYLRYLTESFYSLAQENKLVLAFYTEVPELVMDFDEVKIQHILYNLLSNAIKFTREGGKVTLRVKKQERNGKPWMQLKVQDTGIGISEAQLPHIFDRFYQADSFHTRKGEGTGIGLALTRELVQMMGGSLTVKSEKGRGTEFTLLIPARLEANTEMLGSKFFTPGKLAPELVPDLLDEQFQTTSNEPKQAQNILTTRPQLLLLEDNADVASYIENLLRKDYELTIARNGQEGIDMALERVPDLIISDVMMPEKDGFEVCEILKQDIRTSHIPIILLTAKAGQKDKIAGLKYGADAYLTKPFDKEELLVRLEKLLELRRALRERYSGFDKFSKPAKSEPPAEPTLEDRFLQQLRVAAEQVMADPENTIAKLEQAMNLSQMQLYRKLKALTGQTPSLFIRSVRLQKARHLLETTDVNVSEIAYQVGFNDPAYFSRAFSEEFGQPPSAVRN